MTLTAKVPATIPAGSEIVIRFSRDPLGYVSCEAYIQIEQVQMKIPDFNISGAPYAILKAMETGE